jgi:hypothetical protein
MQNLLTFFKIHFDSIEVSDANLYKFAEDHLSRLKANNDGGDYNAMYNSTLTAFDSYGQSLAKEDAQFTQQQGSTVNVDALIAEFKAQVSRTEGLINFVYGIKSAEYQEFFPLGVTEYTQASKANIEVLMQRMATKTQKYSVKLGVEVAARFSDYLNNYTQARRAQLENIGRVTADRSQTEVTRHTLARQIMSNLLLIANQFLGNPERGMDFFDQSIIRRNNYSNDEGETVTDNISPDSTKTVLSGFDKSATFVLNNVGTTSLRFGISDTENAPSINYGITVSPGDTITATILELNVNGGDKLNVTNLDPNNAGRYDIERLP